MMMDRDALRFYTTLPSVDGVRVSAEKVADLACSHLHALERITELETQLAAQAETNVRGW